MGLRTGTLLIAPPSSSQADQNRLRGPEKSLFERSLGVGREERPPIAVVVQLQRQVSLSFNSCVIVYLYI